MCLTPRNDRYPYRQGLFLDAISQVLSRECERNARSVGRYNPFAEAVKPPELKAFYRTMLSCVLGFDIGYATMAFSSLLSPSLFSSFPLSLF